MTDQTPFEARQTATDHLRAARTAIDDEFGEGFAAAHPELLAALIQACCLEHAIAEGRLVSTEMAETILKLKPRLFG